MTAKINAKTTKETLVDRFKDDAKLLEDSSKLLAFASTLATGSPIGVLAAVELVTKTAGAAISASVTLFNRLFARTSETDTDALPTYDRFRVLYYVLCQRCYIEAIQEVVAKIDTKGAGTSEPAMDEAALRRRRDEIAMQLANLDEAQVSYLYCVEPLAKEVPLFQAYGQWLTAMLTYHGLESWKAIQAAAQADKEARKRFRVFLAEDDPATQWMRNYLALSYQEETSAQLLGDLASIRETLDAWRATAAEQKEQKAQAWADYRKTLRELPDKKETMFNESFGVRKVFLRPAVTYHIRGASGEGGIPKLVPNFGRLIGALVSTRVSGDDLIILCGGPGSGKSTLCRMVASELAGSNEYHPVFLRLRRAREGAEIKGFIEDSLREEGLISRLADLRQVPNLVVILDGFDELVAASRSRLRHFFNVLQEDVSTGPLKTARVIVSGRDTLFPNGEGLPYGSHVISLLPFDKNRVTLWGEKWRTLHVGGSGGSFHPEDFINDPPAGKPKPLHHLVSWPLTLHLVARVHTAGLLTVGGKDVKEVPKAYLYRSILAETANRQMNQVSDSAGRFDTCKMREFLRSLAWEMYIRSTETLDLADVKPLIGRMDPNASEIDLEELTDRAVVNSPQLTKGEETGFEFVHKSFSEYLVAEQLAGHVDRVTFKVQEYGSDEMGWRMTGQEAAAQLAPAIGVRPITEEVQEMLEPMLGGLVEFLKGADVSQVVKQPTRRDGLKRIVERFEGLLDAFLQGESLDTVNQHTRNKLLIRSPLEAFANYCVGLLIIGTAAARQLGNGADNKGTLFQAEQSRGAFWRCVSILQAGGIAIDQKLGNRIFLGLTVKNEKFKDDIVGDLTAPFKLGEFALADGYAPGLSHAIHRLRVYEQALGLVVLAVIASLFPRSSHREQRTQYELLRELTRALDPHHNFFDNITRRLMDAELIVRVGFPDRLNLPPLDYFFDRLWSPDVADREDVVRRCLDMIRYDLEPEFSHPFVYEISRMLEHFLMESDRYRFMATPPEPVVKPGSRSRKASAPPQSGKDDEG
jgi:hypothetical protein